MNRYCTPNRNRTKSFINLSCDTFVNENNPIYIRMWHSISLILSSFVGCAAIKNGRVKIWMGNSEIFTHWISTWKSNVTEWKMSGCFSIQARQLRGLKGVNGEWAKRWIPILTMFGFFCKEFSRSNIILLFYLSSGWKWKWSQICQFNRIWGSCELYAIRSFYSLNELRPNSERNKCWMMSEGVYPIYGKTFRLNG